LQDPLHPLSTVGQTAYRHHDLEERASLQYSLG